MEAYTGKLDMRDDLAPTITVHHRGRRCSMLTHGKSAWSRTAFADGMLLHVLTFDEDLQRYILESLEPQGMRCRRVQAFATVVELKALNGGSDPAGNEEIVSLMAPQLSYDADAFAEAHAAAATRAAEMQAEAAPTDQEKAFYAKMRNSHRLSASQRKEIREKLLPQLQADGTLPLSADE